MIIHQSQNGSVTERKTSPFKRKIHILSEKISNEIFSNKKKSFKNNIFKKQYIDIKNNVKKFEKNQSKTIIPYDQDYYSKIKFKISKNKQNKNYDNNSKNISKKKTKEKTKEKNNYNESKYDNQSDKENIGNIPQTSRYDNNTKEKYLSKFFNNIINSKYNNIFDINIKDNNNNIQKDLMKTINTHSKRYNSTYINPIWKDKLNKIDNDNSNYCNNSDIIANESMNNLEVDLNYKFEIRLLKKKFKQVKKINDKLKYKIIKIKNEQKKKKIELNKQKKKDYIVSKVIDICKNNNCLDKNNFFSSNNETYNGLTISNINSQESKNDSSNQFPAITLFKNMLLNLMDLKYEYGNTLLKNEFISGVKNIIDNNNINNVNNGLEVNKKNIYKYIKGLVKEEIKLKAINNKYKYLSLENKKYYDYFSKLCKKLCIRGLDNLDIFLNDTLVKIQAEFNQINQIKKLVMFNDNYTKNNNPEKNNYSQSYEPFRNKNNSESKMNINISSIVKEEKNNCKRYSYVKDNRKENKYLLENNNIYRNKDDCINKKMFYTYKFNDLPDKNKNKNIIKQNSNEKLNLYDFNKQNNYDKYIKDYYNNDNNDIIFGNDVMKNIQLNKNRREIPHFTKNIKIHTFESIKRNKNKNYNNIINFKKKELGLNNKIKNKMNSKDFKNKKISKSHSKDFFYNNII